jgi:hypothetical protein
LESARYEGKPLKRLVEFYVLWTIGKLDPSDAAVLEEMAPKLSGLYGFDGKWHEVIAATLRFPPTMPDETVKLWQRNLEIARANGTSLAPRQFAEMFVDSNFPE